MRYASPATLLFMPTPQQWADSWSTGVTGAGQKYTQGIQDTQVDVVGRSLAKQGEMVAGFNAVVASGEWARRRGAVSNAEWKTITVAKAQNYATGASAGKPRFQAFAQQAQPFWQSASQSIDAMPSGGKSNALARVGAWYDAMQAFKGQYTP